MTIYIRDYNINKHLSLPRLATQLIVVLLCVAGCASTSEESNPSSPYGPATAIDTIAESPQPARTDTQASSIAVLDVEARVLGEARQEALVQASIEPIRSIYRQCDIDIQLTVNVQATTNSLNLSEMDIQQLSKHNNDQPVVNIIHSTDQQDVAFSYLPSQQIDSSSTAWITNRVSNACLSWIVAHEIAHIVFDHPLHVYQSNNVMNPSCSAGSNYNRKSSQPKFTEQQCVELRKNILNP